jgi:hypothetical protein
MLGHEGLPGVHVRDFGQPSDHLAGQLRAEKGRVGNGSINLSIYLVRYMLGLFRRL